MGERWGEREFAKLGNGQCGDHVLCVLAMTVITGDLYDWARLIDGDRALLINEAVTQSRSHRIGQHRPPANNVHGGTPRTLISILL